MDHLDPTTRDLLEDLAVFLGVTLGAVLIGSVATVAVAWIAA
jgi:hypothetical protein